MLEIENTTDLNENWDFHKGDLGGIWESIRPVQAGDPEDSLLWEHASLPHCFNGADSVNSRVPYYQGYGWYRKDIHPVNPFPNGRVILHFEGAGQVSEVYIDDRKVAFHKGYHRFSES
jgi:beta-galactosidase